MTITPYDLYKAYILAVLINAIILSFILQRLNRKKIPLNEKTGHWSAMALILILSPVALIMWGVVFSVDIIKKIERRAES